MFGGVEISASVTFPPEDKISPGPDPGHRVEVVVASEAEG